MIANMRYSGKGKIMEQIKKDQRLTGVGRWGREKQTHKESTEKFQGSENILLRYYNDTYVTILMSKYTEYTQYNSKALGDYHRSMQVYPQFKKKKKGTILVNDIDNRQERLHMCGRKGKSLQLLLNFVVNLKLFFKVFLKIA